MTRDDVQNLWKIGRADEPGPISAEAARRHEAARLSRLEPAPPTLISAAAARADARGAADEFGHRFTGLEHLLFSLVQNEATGAARMLDRLGADSQRLIERLPLRAEAALRADNALLDRFGRDLVVLVRPDDPTETLDPARQQGLDRRRMISGADPGSGKSRAIRRCSLGVISTMSESFFRPS